MDVPNVSRRINESFFKSQVLETCVSPPQRDENYEKLLQTLGGPNGHVNEALFRWFIQPPPNSLCDSNYDKMLQGLESLSITVENTKTLHPDLPECYMLLEEFEVMKSLQCK